MFRQALGYLIEAVAVAVLIVTSILVVVVGWIGVQLFIQLGS